VEAYVGSFAGGLIPGGGGGSGGATAPAATSSATGSGGGGAAATGESIGAIAGCARRRAVTAGGAELPTAATGAATGGATAGGVSGGVPAIPAATTLKEFKDVSERLFLVQKLRENDWNISRTADVIDTPRSNLYKKLEQYTISQETDG